MTPELTADSPGEASKQVPSTAGMTTKVVKGSMWTLAGQVAPLAVSLVTTPFVIRMLGAEGYGVFILITLIPTYFAFADFGMSMASTKFASEAYAEGDEEKEARIVRTAAVIALCTSIPIAGLLVIFSGTIITAFNVPDYFIVEATLALRIASVTLLITFLNGIFNTPQLTRLRMDINTKVNAITRIAGLIAVPIVVYLGYGVVGAVTVLLIASALNLTGHLFASSRLLSSLIGIRIELTALRRIVGFGFALLAGNVAALLLANLDKAIVPVFVSIEALAFYSVAFTIAGMMNLFSHAMTQSLLPAFSQLQSDERGDQLRALYSLAIRLTLILLIPSVLVLAVGARPFISIWAGEAFGRESVIPFYILIIGISFNILAYYPFTIIMAAGRTDLFAKLYWVELPIFAGLVWFLTSRYGIQGAAIAWTIRMILDSVLLFILARTLSGARFIDRSFPYLAMCSILMAIPFIAYLYFERINLIVLLMLLLSFILYPCVVWMRVLRSEETRWLVGRLNGLIGNKVSV